MSFSYNSPPCFRGFEAFLPAFAMDGTDPQCMFAPIMAMISNSVTPDRMGTMNGLGQSIVSILRVLAPLIGSPLIAWSFGNTFPFDVHFPFFVLGGCSLGMFLIMLLFPKSLNSPKEAQTAEAEVELEEENGGVGGSTSHAPSTAADEEGQALLRETEHDETQFSDEQDGEVLVHFEDGVDSLATSNNATHIFL